MGWPGALEPAVIVQLSGADAPQQGAVEEAAPAGGRFYRPSPSSIGALRHARPSRPHRFCPVQPARARSSRTSPTPRLRTEPYSDHCSPAIPCFNGMARRRDTPLRADLTVRAGLGGRDLCAGGVHLAHIVGAAVAFVTRVR